MAALAGLAVGYAVGSTISGRRAKAAGESRLRKTIESERDARVTLLGTIGAGLGHELKTPLSTLEVNLQLLREEWSDPQTDRERRSARRIDALERSVRKIGEIVQSFVRFAREAKPRPEPVSVNEFIREILEKELPEILSSRGRLGRIHVSYELNPDLPRVPIDAPLLKQVLSNLLANAVESIEGEGRITLGTRLDGDRVEIVVSDSGRGIPRAHADRVWDVYFTTKPSGIGLGLPIARRIVEAHGGSIRFDSNGGTRFTISLPVKDG